MCQALASHFGARRNVNLVLSTTQCLFATVPWVSTHYTGKAIKKHVADFLGHDERDVTDYRIRIQWPTFGSPILAVGYPQALLDGIRNCLLDVDLRLQGATASAFPVHRRYGVSLPSGHSLLAYAEEDGVTAITVEDRAIIQVESLPAHGHDHGLDDFSVWSSRKRFNFSDDGRMLWLSSGATPDAFPGKTLPLKGPVGSLSPAHAVVAACL